MAKSVLDTVIAPMQKYIKPLNMNGMQGRMLRLPAEKNKQREILLLYGHHSSIERMYGIAEALHIYGNVTLPDLPGFGGMDSFYKIGMKPNLDTMADYLASFVKLKYRNKQVTIIGMSLGFVIATRMLQRYPELSKNVDLLVSVVGFTHKYDIKFTPMRKRLYEVGAVLFSRWPLSALFYNLALHPLIITYFYGKTHNAKKKLAHLSDDERKKAIEFEVQLWRSNEVRTYMRMTLEILRLNNCKKQIALPVHHIATDTDQYFDNSVVEQHMRVIFTDYKEHVAVMPNHAPSILASKEEAGPLIPKSMRRLLARKPQK